MPDSQSSEPGFKSLFATVSKIGHFRSLHWRPCSLSCINEYLAIDRGGNVSDLALAHNCCLARMLPGEAELVSEWTGMPGEARSVKRFERSNGLDTALYKNYLFCIEIQIAWKVSRCIDESCRHYNIVTPRAITFQRGIAPSYWKDTICFSMNCLSRFAILISWTLNRTLGLCIDSIDLTVFN